MQLEGINKKHIACSSFNNIFALMGQLAVKLDQKKYFWCRNRNSPKIFYCTANYTSLCYTVCPLGTGGGLCNLEGNHDEGIVVRVVLNLFIINCIFHIEYL